ncbi:MAG: DUF2497 domain-containing protein [Rickettsiales bacterium]
MEAKKKEETVGDDDLSMEDILQSIRRIIADDEDGDEEVKAEDAKTNGEDVKPDAVNDSDILELTDMIEDDGSITNLKDGNNDNKEDSSVDVLDNIDEALKPEEKIEGKEEKTEEAPVVQEEVKAEEAVADSTEEPKQEATDDSLISKETENTASAALSKLKKPDKPAAPHVPSPAFRSGKTVEDMVEEMLRPMMKEWLDDNLPEIVERLVAKEIARLSRD